MKRVSGLLVVSWVFALAQVPDTLWTRTYGGEENDEGFSVKQTSDGGYIIVGQTYSFGAGEYDIWFIKTDSIGDTLWTRTYGGVGSERGNSVQQTSDGGYIIAGSTSSYGAGADDVWLLKTDSLGDTLWTRTYGGTGWDYGMSAQQTTDGGYIIAGNTNSFGAGTYDYDIWLIKTDSLGNILWVKTYGGDLLDICNAMQQTTDGGYIIAGSTTSYSQYTSVYLIKTDQNGEIDWIKVIDVGNYSEEGRSVQQTSDGGYIITGVTRSDNEDLLLIKTDANGDTEWIKIYDHDQNDYGRYVFQTQDGGYAIVGWTGYLVANRLYLWIIKTTSRGDTVWTRIYGEPGGYGEAGHSIQQTVDGGYIVCGGTTSYGAGGVDIWLLKLGSETNITEDKQNNANNNFLRIQNYPNPFIGSTLIEYYFTHSAHINITIYNSLGQKIITLVNRNESTGLIGMSLLVSIE